MRNGGVRSRIIHPFFEANIRDVSRRGRAVVLDEQEGEREGRRVLQAERQKSGGRKEGRQG
jgi:hypothetical protein